MKRTVITGSGVSKAYRLGLAQSRLDFRETIMQTLRTPFKRMRKYSENWGDSEDTFWAREGCEF